jgi:hypothetical protein
MNHRWTLAAGLTALGACWLAGFGACLPPEPEQAAQDLRCTPGEETFCRCRGGKRSGMMRCLESGRGFGPCETEDGVCSGPGDGEEPVDPVDPVEPPTGAGAGGSAGASTAASSGGGGEAPACAHEPCLTGEPLAASCHPCVTAVCEQEAHCCASSWDAPCITAAQKICHLKCQPPPPPPPPPPGGECAHALCATGVALAPECDDCATKVCQEDDYCCTVEWDALCVTEATESCALACACVHAPCKTGAALAPSCDPCVAKVCAADAFCCDFSWDSLCVSQAKAACACP